MSKMSAVSMRSVLAVCSIMLILSGCSTLSKDRFGKESSRELMEKASSALEEADRHYRAGNLDTAEALYLDIVKEDQNSADALYRLGNISFKRGDYQAASGYFSRSIDSLPRNAKAHYNLAVTYLTLAEQHFKYYAATVPEGTGIENVSDILADIYEFASFRGKDGQSQQQGGTGGSSNGSADGALDALESLADEFQ